MRASILGLLALSACTREDGLTRTLDGAIAVTAGDFDNVAAPFQRLVVAHESYEGLISVATWDAEYDPDAVSLKVERLFDGEELDGYGLLMVASGTRGFGLHTYNGVAPDDQFVSDEFVIGEVQSFVDHGGILVVTDWGYDLIEAAWPDAIEFVGDDEVFDGAQLGSIGTVTASVDQEALVDAIGMDEMSVRYDFSNWAVAEEVAAADAVVWVSGDVAWEALDGQGEQQVEDAPLLMSFQPPGSSGMVVYSTFHIDAQTATVIDQVMETVVGPFDEGDDTIVAPIE